MMVGGKTRTAVVEKIEKAECARVSGGRSARQATEPFVTRLRTIDDDSQSDYIIRYVSYRTMLCRLVASKRQGNAVQCPTVQPNRGADARPPEGS